MDKLGMKAKDKITGFKGIIVSKINYLFGCSQYGIAPEADDGKVKDTHYFDEGRVEITGKGISSKEVTVPENGADVNTDCPRE